jgi:hypothetical protein
METLPATDAQVFAHSYSAGTAVFDAQGEKMGVVSLPPMQGNYLIVEQRRLLAHTLYIPHAAIYAQDANGIYLNLTKDVEQWRIPPGDATAVEATSPTDVLPDPVPGQEGRLWDGGLLPGPLPADPLGRR